jgi:hypothetical protein
VGWDCLIVGLLLRLLDSWVILVRSSRLGGLLLGYFWLHHIQSLANVTFVVFCSFYCLLLVTIVTKLFIAVNSVTLS